MKTVLRKGLFILFLTAMTQGLSAQVIIPGDYAREYYDLLLFKDTSLNKPIVQYPSIVTQFHSKNAPSWNIWGENFKLNGGSSVLSIVDPVLRTNYNSLIPMSYNDGAQWNGRGANLFLSAGVAGRVGILQYAFVPNIQVSQNKDFFIPDTPAGRSEYAYPFDSRIDWVQKYGEGSFTNFDLGQSEIRLIYKNATVGVSTENFRWGVTQFSPILMSYNAPGFPHIDIGTNVPVGTKIGRLEGRIFWGRLVESDYFDNETDNETGFISGMHIGYQPSFFPQLNVGLNRVLNTRWSDGDLSFKDAFALFTKTKGKGAQKNDEYDQMLSVYFDFAFREVGFRTYLEFARNDFPGSVSELFQNPDRSRAFTLGLMKTFELGNERLLSVLFESTTLSTNQLQRLSTGNPTYYVHPWSVRGFTNRGQIMGAAIGPGSNSNFVRVDLYQPEGKWSLTLTRVRFNDDYFVSAFSGQSDFPTDFERTIRLDYVGFFNKLTINPNFSYTYRNNWYYVDENEATNIMAGVNLSYRID